MPAQEQSCPDCSGALIPIQIIDKLDPGFSGSHGALEYAVGDAKQSKWRGRFPVEGRVHAYMCDACGRVLLYAKAATLKNYLFRPRP